MKKLLNLFLISLLIILFCGCSVNSEPEIIEGNAVLDSSSGEKTSEESRPAEVPSANSASEDASSDYSESESQSSEKSESASSSSALEKESSSSSSSESSSSQSSSLSSSETSASSETSSKEEPVNNNPAPQKETKAVWISYLEYQTILLGKTEKQFKQNIDSMFSKLSADGFNTVFVHVRSHSDAMYDSDIFPWSVYCTGTEGKNPGFDPLEIMVNSAHASGLRIEAWINPYRIKGSSDVSKISSGSPAYKWIGTDKVIVLQSGIYYNPADEEVIDLVVNGVKEILNKYDVDGIHFDDYFYPTTAESFDKSHYNAYKSSGGTLGLAAWRRQNVNNLIKEVYSAIKSIDSTCRFGVSPTGNMESNYSELYCDVYTWVTNKGYIDYICPQLYYGFNNASKPYLEVLSEFNDMIKGSNVELIVGLAAYKCGASDNYAGTGKTEWISYSDIISRQVIAARNESRYSGFALYRYDSFYNPSSDVKKSVAEEKENLSAIM